MPKADYINIVSAADSRFSTPLAVMVRSVCDNISSGSSLRFFILDGGLSNGEIKKIVRSLSRSRHTIEWITPVRSRFNKFRHDRYLSRTNHFRLQIGELIPAEVSRVIYLDADLLALEDITKLWKIGLGDNIVGAVQDPGIPTVSSPGGVRNFSELGVSPDSPYFNAGVLLVDLDAWRHQRIGEQIERYLLSAKEKINWYNQDGFNAVLAGRWLPLEERWNRIVSPGGLYAGHSPKLDGGILHFATIYKPWNRGYTHPAREIYNQYLSRTDSGRAFSKLLSWIR